MLQSRKRQLTWALWALLVFVIFNVGSTKADSQAFTADYNSPSWSWTPASLVRYLRAHLSENGSPRLYFAYCNASLGRPIRTRAIRSSESWWSHFSAVNRGAQPRLEPITVDRPLCPYRDYLVEYPPGFFLWAMPPALVTQDAERYRDLFSVLMGILLTLAVIASQRLARHKPALAAPERLLPLSIAAVALLGVITVRRYDAVISVLLCATLWTTTTGRPRLAGALFGVAIATKVTPVFVAPILALYLVTLGRRKELLAATVAATAAFCAVVVPMAIAAGPGALWDVLRFHAQRPLQLESTFGALLGLASGDVRVVHSFGSFNVVPRMHGASPLTWLATPLALAAQLGAFWITRRRLRESPPEEAARWLLAGVVAALASWMALGKIFSPQYLIWLLPCGVLASIAAGGRRIWLFLAALGLTQLIYPVSYRAMLTLAPWSLCLVLARNSAVLLWASSLLVGRRTDAQSDARVDHPG